LSTDDIVFEDVTYREPRRVRRPDRDRRWACIAYELPGPQDLPIYLDRKPADAIERHALSDTSVELGGILLGQECNDDVTGEPFVWITEAIAAKHYENTQASFTYTHESWEEISRERDRVHPELDIVGWYHTHPDFGVFLSSHDLFIHHHFFAQTLQVAYVVDPIRQTRAFFQWRDGQMDEVGGFFLSADRGDRIALARLVNDLENFPNTGGEGGALSPRLEAELIAMLTRSHQTVAVAPPQSAALGMLLGVLLGALLVVGAIWLQHVTQGINEQIALIKHLDKNIAQSAKDHDAALNAERVRVKEDVLDTLLKEVKAGAKQDKFTSLYTQAIEQRNTARREVESLETERVALGDLATKERQEQTRLTQTLSDLKKENERLTKVEANDQKDIERLRDELAAQKLLVEDSKAGTLQRHYDIAWYVAAAGVGLSVLLGLGLVAALAREPRPQSVEPRDEPPHAMT
jgi:proteasome lid subunit RPN8/RPN11